MLEMEEAMAVKEDEEEELVMSSANAFDMPPHWLEKHPKAVR